jgi:hypothetical protein
VSVTHLPHAGPVFARADVAIVSVALGIGAVTLLVGWWGVSGTADHADQWLWLNLAVGGLVVSGAGIGLWLLGGTRRLRGLRQAVGAALTAGGLAGSGLTAVPTSGPVATGSVTAARMTRFHRPDCNLMGGKQAEAVTATRAGQLRPCGVCHPEREDAQ